MKMKMTCVTLKIEQNALHNITDMDTMRQYTLVEIVIFHDNRNLYFQFATGF